MLRNTPFLATTILSGALIVSSAFAATFTQDFEAQGTSDYTPVNGVKADDSSLAISTAKAHGGKQSLKLSYNSTGGYIQFMPAKIDKLAFTGDVLHLSMWVMGSGQRDFAGGAIRLLDANNESFQFDIPGFGEAMAGEGWRELKADIDLTKTGAHWGDNSDGKLDRPFGYLGLAASRNADTAVAGTVYIDDLKLSDGAGDAAPATAPAAMMGAASIALAPVIAPTTGAGSPFLNWVSAPGAPVTFRATVVSPDGAPGNVVQWKVRDAFGAVIAQGKEALAKGEREKSVTFRIQNPPRGVLYATASLLNASEELLTEATSRASVFTPHVKSVPINDFIWAVAAHVGRDNGKDAPDEIALMRLLGFAASRSDMSWNNIQPTPTTWDWTSTDRIYDTFKKEGIMPMPLLGYGAQWATTGDANSTDWHQWNNTPPRTDAFVAFARAAVNRYKGQTHYWEIWNEPDISFWLGTADQYAALVSATVPAIKAEQPNAQVLNGGFSETRRRPDFIPTYLKDATTLPDIYATHTHGPFENMLRAETGVDTYLKDAGLTGAKRPKVWLNEAGYSNANSTPESEQAIQLVKKMAYAPAAGFSAYVWYDLRDDGTDPKENEHNFGLVKQNFAPKASGVAVGTLLDTIGTRKFTGRLPVGNNGYGLVYGGGGQTVLTAWRQAKGDAVLPLVMRATAPAGKPLKLERRDIFGNTTPVATQDGLFLLSMGNVPQYIVASGDGVKFELAAQNGMLLDYAPAVVITSGESLPWQVKVANPFPTALKGRLIVDGSAPIDVNVAPKTTRPYQVVLKGNGKPGTRQTINLQLESGQLPAPLKGTAEVQTAYLIPAAPKDLTVDLPRSGLVSLFEATPMQELHFKDAADLSASAQFQKTPQGVKVRVTVGDQTHFVVPEPGQWWSGDSIQWAIGLPNGQMWEWMGALLPDGPKMVLSLAPDGKTGVPAPVSIRREGVQTIYEWTLPATLPNGTPLPERFNFDFIVNDNDGAGRKGWIEWAPGIGMEKNPATFAPLAIER